jgi:hypothetical protein
MGTAISNEPDTTIEQTTHIPLTSLCESHITASAAMPIAPLLIRI